MTVSVKMEVVGFAELEKAMQKLRAEMGGKEGNITNNALKTVAMAVEDRMKFLAPVDTGRLQRSIFKKREPRPRHLSELYHVGPAAGKNRDDGKRDDEKGAWYAAIVNFKGGKGGRGKGFVSNAILPEFHARMFEYELAKRILPKARKIGAENEAKVSAAVKKANAAFAYKK